MTKQRQTYRFVGAITAVSALTVTRPDEKFPSPANSPFRLSSKASRMPRLGPLREESPCYFPATSLRGAFRRAGRNMIRRAIIRNTGEQTPWSVDTHYMMTQGVDTTNKTINEKVSGSIGIENELRDENVFLSLFGRWKLPGHLSIDNAIPTNDDCLYVEGRGARSNDFVRSPEQIQFLGVDEAKRLKTILEQDSLAAEETGDIDEQIKDLKKDLRTVKDDDEQGDIRERIKELEARKKGVKAAKQGSQESIQRPIEGFEAMKPGTDMTHRMMVQNADELELGLTLATIREFSRSPYVGGHRSLHCGEIKGHWTVKYWPEDSDEPITAGEVTWSADGFEITDHDDRAVLSKALRAWDEVASDFNKHGLDFERFLLVA